MSASRREPAERCPACAARAAGAVVAEGLGLDELMIVNPRPEEALGYFLGDDGDLYEVTALESATATPRHVLASAGRISYTRR